MVDSGIHKIHLFHTSDLHFYFSTNTKARWWILKSTKQVKCWIRCIYHCTKHQPQHRERGYFLKPLYTFYTLTIQSESKDRWRLSTVSTNCNQNIGVWRLVVLFTCHASRMAISNRCMCSRNQVCDTHACVWCSVAPDWIRMAEGRCWVYVG